jgi:hypothetical protein
MDFDGEIRVHVWDINVRETCMMKGIGTMGKLFLCRIGMQRINDRFDVEDVMRELERHQNESLVWS